MYEFSVVYNLEKFWIITALLFSIILTSVIGVNIFCINMKEDRKYSLVVLNALILAVQTAQFLVIISPPAELNYFVRAQLAALSFLGPVFLLYCYTALYGHFPGRLPGLAAFAVPFAAVVALFYNDYHQMFYSVKSLSYIEFNQLFIYCSVYNYLCATAGLYLLHIRLRKNGGTSFRQSVSPWAAVIIVLAADIFQLVNPDFSLYYLTPASISLAQLVLLYGCWFPTRRQSILAARVNALDCINEAIILTDTSGNVLFFNQVHFNRLAGIEKGEDFDSMLDKLLTRSAEREKIEEIKILRAGNRPGGGVFTLKLPEKKHYSYYVEPLKKDGSYTGATLVAFRDVSEYEDLINRLNVKKDELTAMAVKLREYSEVVKRLTEEKERGRIVQDVNHTVGDLISQIINNLEEVAAADDCEPPVLKEKVRVSIEWARKGIQRIRQSVSALNSTDMKEVVTDDQGCNS